MFQAYFGGLLCCSWSPDGKYIATGGEDDMISIFDVKNKCIVVRGIGHNSFVSAISYDPFECDGEKYRIISVGQDCAMLFWDMEKVIELVNDCNTSLSSVGRSRNCK